MEDNFKVNFIVAICVGFAGAIYFTFFPEIFREKKGFKDFIGIFILSFIGFAFVGFIFALILGTF
jgi:fructose-specific phosphotransferase system IIC component